MTSSSSSSASEENERTKERHRREIYIYIYIHIACMCVCVFRLSPSTEARNSFLANNHHWTRLEKEKEKNDDVKPMHTSLVPSPRIMSSSSSSPFEQKCVARLARILSCWSFRLTPCIFSLFPIGCSDRSRECRETSAFTNRHQSCSSFDVDQRHHDGAELLLVENDGRLGIDTHSSSSLGRLEPVEFGNVQRRPLVRLPLLSVVALRDQVQCQSDGSATSESDRSTTIDPDPFVALRRPGRLVASPNAGIEHALAHEHEHEHDVECTRLLDQWRVECRRTGLVRTPIESVA